MVDVVLWFVTILGGVFGALIGFLLIGATGVLLALPFVMMTKRSEEAKTPHGPLAERY